MTARFVSTHSVVLVLPMHIAHSPVRGASIHADAASSRPGGGFRAAPLAQGSTVLLTGPAQVVGRVTLT